MTGHLTQPYSFLTRAQIPHYIYRLVITLYRSNEMMHAIFPDFQSYDTDAFKQLCSPATLSYLVLMVRLIVVGEHCPRVFLDDPQTHQG